MIALPMALERGLWYATLGFGLVVALVVAGMLALLIRYLMGIERSVDGLLEGAGKVAENTASIPQLESTAPVLHQIADEGVIQDAYMNALTEGYTEEAQVN